jgi:outer membrane protein assembly factor BamB
MREARELNQERMHRDLLIAAAAVLAILGFLTPASASGQPVTAAADSLRTSWYPDEKGPTPRLLEDGQFGEIFDTPVKGQVYAQPLVSGNTLLAVTEDNWIYGLDPQTGGIQWQRNVGTPWNPAEFGCPGGVKPHVGITGTPVIDPATNVAYFFSKTYASGNSGPAVWKMHAVDQSSGDEQQGFPVPISGEAQNLPGVSFDPAHQLQRPALLLMNGVVYAAFGSHCDTPPYQGWIVGVSTSGQTKAMWATSESGAAIWQSGGGLVSDGEGQIVFTSGNGPHLPPPGPGGSPPEGSLGESVARLTVQSDGTLKATDFFSPFNNVELSEDDRDLGSGAPLGLPSPYFGTDAIPHLIVQVGKPGTIYLLDRDSLGGMGQGEGADDVVQEIPETSGLWGSMAVWPGDGGYIYIPSSGSLEVLKYGTGEVGTPQLSLVAKSSEHFGYASGSPLVTSNGTAAGSAIVWITRCSDPPECEGSTLNAYSAVPTEGSPKLLWSGEVGIRTKFARPDASAGRIYVGTADGHLRGFGSTVPAPTTAPAATTAIDTTAPVGFRLRFSPRHFRSMRKRAPSIAAASAKTRRNRVRRTSLVSYRLTEAARVRFIVRRRVIGRKKGRRCLIGKQRRRLHKAKRCSRFVRRKGAFSDAGKQGANRFRFSGYVGGRRLRPGVYRMVGVPSDAAGNRGRRFGRSFAIARR